MSDPRERCILAGLALRSGGQSPAPDLEHLTVEESMAELSALVSGAGAEVLGRMVQVRDRPVPATLLGSGKVQELRNWVTETACDFVLFDHDLTPSQQRNLERATGCRVLDRTELILDIFARHARTREGRLQVELAQLSYLLPRLAGRGTQMSRLGGGIGTRGPGETQLEHDRRKIRRRIARLRQELRKVRSTRRLQRTRRQRAPVPTVALCGYTNAGKSSLFNALTAAGVTADERMFATLDPTIRRLELPSKRPALLSDTVGFIRNLPPALVAAFRATLEEVTESTLILHVVDLSAEHRAVHRVEVESVLNDLGAGGKPQVLVLNKCDLVEAGSAADEAEREQSRPAAVDVVTVSARTGQGLADLLRAMDKALAEDSVIRARFRIPYASPEVLALVYRHGTVIERRDRNSGSEVLAEVPRALAGRLRAYRMPRETASE